MTTWEKIIENQMKENEKKILEMYKEALDKGVGENKRSIQHEG